MLPSISNHPRFQEDCQRYKDKIDMLTDPTVQAELNSMLAKLIHEAKSIDQFYNELPKGGSINNQVDRSREVLTSLRKELESKLSKK